MTKYEWESELKKNIHRLPDEEIKRVMEYYTELFNDKVEDGTTERAIIAEFGNPVDVAFRIISEYDGELKPSGYVPATPKYDRGSETVAIYPNGAAVKMPVQNIPANPYSAPVNNVNIPANPYSAPVNNANIPANPYSAPVNNVNIPANPYSAPVNNVNIPTNPYVAPVNNVNQPINQYNNPTQSNGKKQSSGKIRGGRLAVFLALSIILVPIYIGLAVGLWSVVLSIGVSGGACVVAGVVYVVATIITMAGMGSAFLVQLGSVIAVIGVGILLMLLCGVLFKLGVKITKGTFRALKKFLTAKKVSYEN